MCTVPPPASSCTATAVYDYYSNHLNSIEIVWETVSVCTLMHVCPHKIQSFQHALYTNLHFQDPPEQIAPGITADIQSYQVSFIPTSEASTITTTISDPTLCQDKCALVIPNTGLTSLYYSVFVAAENILGPGERKSCSSQSIGRHALL